MLSCSRGFSYVSEMFSSTFDRIFPPGCGLVPRSLLRTVGRCIRRVRHIVDVRHRPTVIDDFLFVYSPASIIRVIGISILEPVSGQWINEPWHRPRRSRNPSVACITPHRLWKWTIFKCDWNTREFGLYWVSIRHRKEFWDPMLLPDPRNWYRDQYQAKSSSRSIGKGRWRIVDAEDIRHVKNKKIHLFVYVNQCDVFVINTSIRACWMDGSFVRFVWIYY